MADKSKFEDDGFLARWIAGDITEEEARAFGRWAAAHPVEQKRFEALRAVWNRGGAIELPAGLSEAERWRRIGERIKLKTQPAARVKPPRRFLHVIFFAAAAVTALVFAFFWLRR